MKTKDYTGQISNNFCYILSRAITIGEIKNMLSELGDDDDKVLFKNKDSYIEILEIKKAVFNKNHGKKLLETDKLIEFVDGLLIEMI